MFDEFPLPMTLSSSLDDPQEPVPPFGRLLLQTPMPALLSIAHAALFAEPARREPFALWLRLPLQTREVA